MAKILLLCALAGCLAAAAPPAVGSPAAFPGPAAPGLLPLFPGASPYPLAGHDQRHTVAPGEFLYAIARRYNVAYPAIARANRIADPNRIYAGQELLIPRRLIVPAAPPAGPGTHLVLNIPEFRLFFFRGGRLERVYPAAVGLVTWQTPRDPFTVTSRVKKPAWHVPPGISRENEWPPGTVVPPGPDNPLGDFWIGTSIRHTGLHGTNVPMSVGLPVSRGCVRLYPEDIRELFALVGSGDTGRFIYEPVKATVAGGVFLLEVHPDIYGLFPDPGALAARKLEAAAASAPAAPADPDLVRRALGEARGVPVPVSRPSASFPEDGLH